MQTFTCSFDLILLDPPYAEVSVEPRRAAGERGPVISPFSEILTEAARLLAASGILVLEHASTDEPSVSGLTLDRRRRHGDTTLSLFRREAPDGR